jgi:hypothetical protein
MKSCKCMWNILSLFQVSRVHAIRCSYKLLASISASYKIGFILRRYRPYLKVPSTLQIQRYWKVCKTKCMHGHRGRWKYTTFHITSSSQFKSIQFIYVLGQQPEGQLLKQHKCRIYIGNSYYKL